MVHEFSTARAFVAGATGYTGRAIVAALRQRQLTTVAHLRPDRSDLPAWQARFEALGASADTTAWEVSAMTATLQRLRPSVIFACLGTTRRRAGREGIAAPYDTVDYGLSKLLLDAAVASGLRPRFVYLSAIGADESSANPYLRVRGRLERELRASGLPSLVVRPAFITGSDREEVRPAERIAARVSDALLAAAARLGAGTLHDRYASLTGAQLAEGMVRLALAARAPDETAAVADIRAALRGNR